MKFTMIGAWPMGFLQSLPTPAQLGSLALIVGLGAAIISMVASMATFGAFLIEIRRLSREKTQEEREQSALGTERRRSAETNVLIQHKLEMTPLGDDEAAEAPFLISYLALKNEGDGPVDIWASLVSARMLSSKFKPGIALRSRDLEWETDLQQYFWNIDDVPTAPSPPFAGISTTKNMLPSVDQFVRLAPHEIATIRRTDGVNDLSAFRSESPLTLLYRVFSVARGYPLGEVMRQIGGGPPDPLVNASRNQLLFRSLAQPNVKVWRDIQRAILHFNRFSFRCASGEENPLALISDPDGWRFFLLHYKDFLTPDILQRLRDADDLALTAEYFDSKMTFPRDLTHDPRFITYCEICREKLQPMLRIWERLKAAIALCKTYDEHGYKDSEVEAHLRELVPHYLAYDVNSQQDLEELKPHLDPALPVKRPLPDDIPDDGYAVRIHYDKLYRTRWLALMEEGYLVSKPFYHERRFLFIKRPQRTFTANDIPPDPRVLEPYVMRTHFFATSVDANTGEIRQSLTFGDSEETRIINILPNSGSK